MAMSFSGSSIYTHPLEKIWSQLLNHFFYNAKVNVFFYRNLKSIKIENKFEIAVGQQYKFFFSISMQKFNKNKRQNNVKIFKTLL